MGVSLCMSRQGHSKQPYEDSNKLLLLALSDSTTTGGFVYSRTADRNLTAVID